MSRKRFLTAVACFTWTAIALTAGNLPGQGGATKITADEFFATFKKGAKATAAKFKDADLELTDTLTFVGRHFSGKACVEVKGGKGKNEILRCFTTDPEPWAKFAAGQKVKIVGKWSDSVVPEMKDCEVTAVGKGGPIPVGAEQLAKEANQNLKGMEAKYKDSSLVVSGKLAEIAPQKSGAVQLTLQGAGKTIVRGTVPEIAKETTKDLKPGQTITFAGKYAYAAAGEVVLDLCWMVQKK